MPGSRPGPDAYVGNKCQMTGSVQGGVVREPESAARGAEAGVGPCPSGIKLLLLAPGAVEEGRSSGQSLPPGGLTARACQHMQRARDNVGSAERTGWAGVWEAGRGRVSRKQRHWQRLSQAAGGTSMIKAYASRPGVRLEGAHGTKHAPGVEGSARHSDGAGCRCAHKSRSSCWWAAGCSGSGSSP